MRSEDRAVEQYLEALEAERPRRGRRPTTETLETRLRLIRARLSSADPVSRVHLIQERINVERELERRRQAPDLQPLEAGFVEAAGELSRRRGVTWAAWRAAGVSAAVLRKAGIRPGG